MTGPRVGWLRRDSRMPYSSTDTAIIRTTNLPGDIFEINNHFVYRP